MTEPFRHPDATTFSGRPPEQVFGDVVRMLLRHRFLVIGLPLLGAMVGVGYKVAQPARYSASAAFMGAGSDLPAGGLGGIAAQFGFRMPTADASQSPQFYADLLRSRSLLRKVVDTQYTYRTRSGEKKGTLVEAFEISGNDRPVQLEAAIDALDRRLGTGIGRETGVIRMSVTSESPELSSQIAERFLALLNSFNLETRQVRARAERRFAEARLAEATRELRAAQDRLREFSRHNRIIRGPDLEAQRDWLAQEVTARQQVYTTVLQAFEQARIDEVRDTPMITIVESPIVPVRRDRRGLPRVAIFGGVLGGLLGVSAAIALEMKNRSRVAIAGQPSR